MLAALGLLVLGMTDETWFMPGPVSRVHARHESRCVLCHQGFKGAPKDSCLKCKTDMNLDMDKGVHKYAPLKECADCHVEHRTRDYPLASAWVDENRFDHSWTGFDLGKYHSKIECRRCHKAGENYRDVKSACDQCHQDFFPGLWDHARTGCNLDSLHNGFSCDKCHVNGWGPGKNPSCHDCHPEDDFDIHKVCLKTAR